MFQFGAVTKRRLAAAAQATRGQSSLVRCLAPMGVETERLTWIQCLWLPLSRPRRATLRDFNPGDRSDLPTVSATPTIGRPAFARHQDTQLGREPPCRCGL